ncbi:MAG: aldo/keto reductase [Caulobacteraceae bacterium]
MMESLRKGPWPTVALPMTTVTVPQLGLGCGDLYAGGSREASLKIVRAAFDAGIRYFDVARLYGDGSAEAVLGEALAPVRDQVVITTKAGIMPWSMQLGRRIRHKAAKALARFKLGAEPPPPGERYGAFSTRELTRSLESSLKALRTDHVDLLLLHECHLADARAADTRALLERWRTEGKIRGYGVATHFADTVEILRACPEAAPVVQLASDALNHNAARLPTRPPLVIAHSSLKKAMPEVRRRLDEDPGLAARWAEATGAPAADTDTIARVLLGLAAADNPQGLVLFSSSKPERIAAVARGRPSAEALAAAAGLLESA